VAASRGLEQFRDKLLQGMLERNYTPQFATQIYQQILASAAMASLNPRGLLCSAAYSSSWLRCHEPAAFVAGLLNSWPMGFYAPAQLVNDARRNGVSFRPADVQMMTGIAPWNRRCGGPVVRVGLCMITVLCRRKAKPS